MGSKILGVTSVVSIVIALAAVLQTAEAETHSVSWSNTVGADFYTSWATNHTFKVDDILGNHSYHFILLTISAQIGSTNSFCLFDGANILIKKNN